MGALALLLILAVLQGITEFLPVSSSGHLVLARSLLPGGETLPSDATVEILLHLGTLIAVILFYRREIFALGWGVLGRGPAIGEQRHLFALLFLASLPAAALGFGFKGIIDDAFAHPGFAASALLVTGSFLYWSRRFPADGLKLNDLRWRAALLIGFAQAFAILPGISRSGATIVAGLALGLSVPAAAAFSFLLSIPAILGASLLKAPEVSLEQVGGTQAVLIAVGVSAVVGLASLGLLVRIGRTRRLWWFAPYCWIAGLAALTALALGA